jgi:hypothetical protein
MLLDQAMKILALLLVFLKFQSRLSFLRRVLQLLEIAQLKASLTIVVILER